MRNLAIRWTIGDVSARGFEALQLSIWGAHRIFGPEARYVVCINQLPLELARERTGNLPVHVEWRDNSREVPEFIAKRLAPNMAEGVGWKLAPVRIAPGGHELALDNDCILWSIPSAIATWMASDGSDIAVLAEDVRRCLGQFDCYCGPGYRNSGIRGLPPGFEYSAALEKMLEMHDVTMSSELDEQGLQAAVLERSCRTLLVTLDEVTICSPFWPHIAQLGSCGAHFVGLNARHIPWCYFDRPADEWMTQHWTTLRPQLARNVGLERSVAEISG